MKNLFKKIEQNEFLFHFIKYTSVGIVNTIVIFGLLFLLKDLLKLPLYTSNIIAYTGGLICNFTLNKIFTFKSRKFKPLEILLFLVAFGTSYGIQRLTLALMLNQFQLGENLASFVAYPLYGITFFLLCKYLVFYPRVRKEA